MLRRTFIATLLAVSFASPSLADDVLLEVSFSDRDPVRLSRADLEAMPATEFSTSTLWTEGVVVFQGVSLFDFVKEMHIEGDTIEAIAINDYLIEVPIEDAVKGGPMIAYRMNGEEMSPRDKGPLWIVYPYDSNVEYQSETYYSRSVWQMNRIVVP